jgi:methylmalonyl-CoA/ethylmalonyl-CoA epimerase
MSTISHIDHIAIAVKSINEVRNFYELALGFSISSIEEMSERGIRVAFISLGDTTIELMEPMHSHSEISSFLEKRGPGIHHVAFNTKNLKVQEDVLRKNGIKLVYGEHQKGAHGNKVNFIHPSSSGGALMELVQSCHEPSLTP